MYLNPDKCVACGNCTYVCPMGAIYIDPTIKRAVVDRNECVECYACFNGLSQEHLNPTIVRTMRKVFQMMRLRFDPEPDVCPTAAFEPDTLEWPRVVRRAFSDPRVPHESTGVSGRGTEEVKTNDVSGRVKVGEVGFTIEFGRPGVGVWVGTRCDENGDENVVAPILERLGYNLARAKTNIGLGKVSNTPEESSKKEEPVAAAR